MSRAFPPAFTMIETLAVVAVLAIATALGAVQLSASSRRSRLDTAVHTLVLADAAARSHALTGRPATLMLTGEHVSVASRRVTESRPLWRRTLPRGISAALLDMHGSPIESLGFDVTGRSPDYARSIRQEGGAAAVVWVSGITGCSTAIPETVP